MKVFKYAIDIKSVRGLGRGVLDQTVVLCKIKLVMGWMERIKKRNEV